MTSLSISISPSVHNNFPKLALGVSLVRLPKSTDETKIILKKFVEDLGNENIRPEQRAVYNIWQQTFGPEQSVATHWKRYSETNYDNLSTALTLGTKVNVRVLHANTLSLGLVDKIPTYFNSKGEVVSSWKAKPTDATEDGTYLVLAEQIGDDGDARFANIWIHQTVLDIGGKVEGQALVNRSAPNITLSQSDAHSLIG